MANRSDYSDFENVLSTTEKMLTTKYKRVLNSGKGSRAVVILIPEKLQNYIELLLRNRKKYISPDNEYVFAIPGSTIPWGKGDIAIRSLASKMELKNYRTITSNKLRKHIATVMQILSLTKDESKQLSQFMGHTEKTHQEFYELPVDIYQTAKVSKILLMMEKGVPIEHKGKSLAEIDFDINLEYAELNDDNDNGVIVSNEQVHVNPPDIVEMTPTNVSPKRTKKRRISSSDDKENLDGVNNTQLPTKENVAVTRKGWSTDEVAALKSEFKTFFESNIYPTGPEIKNFIVKTKTNRTVAVIKSKLQHLGKAKKN